MVFIILTLAVICVVLLAKLLDARDYIEYQQDCIASGEAEVYDIQQRLKKSNEQLKRTLEGMCDKDAPV